DNSASFTATDNATINSGGNGYGVQLAFNSVGYASSNVLFAFLDSLFGGNSGNVLESTSPADDTAYLSGTTVTADGNIAVTANNTDTFSATTSNVTTSSFTAFQGTSTKAVSATISQNLLNGSSIAHIDK